MLTGAPVSGPMVRVSTAALRPVCLALALVVAVGGCTAKRLPPLAVDPLDALPGAQQRDGLVIAAEALLDDRASRKQHGAAFLREGLLAVRVAARNDGSRSWILQRSRVSLQIDGADAGAAESKAAGGELGGAMQATSMAAAAGSFALVGAAALGLSAAALPLFYAGSKLDADASAVQQHLLLSELHPTTLSPGEAAAGLAFFPIERPPQPGERWTIGVDALALPEGRVESFAFPVPVRPRFPSRPR